MRGALVELDERDAAIVAERAAQILAEDTPEVGAFIRHPDGSMSRITHVWPAWDGEDPYPGQLQTWTEYGGSYYLGDGYASYSGSLDHGVKADTVTRTDEVRDGSAWIFHHNYSGAGRGVDVLVPFPVWECTEPNPHREG